MTGRYTTPQQQICTEWSNISCTGIKLTNFMEKRPSWEANPQVHYRTHKNLWPVPVMSQINLVNAPHPTSWRSILISFHHVCLGLPSGLLPWGLHFKCLACTLTGWNSFNSKPNNTCMWISYPPGSSFTVTFRKFHFLCSSYCSPQLCW